MACQDVPTHPPRRSSVFPVTVFALESRRQKKHGRCIGSPNSGYRYGPHYYVTCATGYGKFAATISIYRSGLAQLSSGRSATRPERRLRITAIFTLITEFDIRLNSDAWCRETIYDVVFLCLYVTKTMAHQLLNQVSETRVE